MRRILRTFASPPACVPPSSAHRSTFAVAGKITDALTAYNEAVRRLSIGKVGVLSIGQRIRNLGVKTKKPMPSMLIDGVSIAPPSDDSEESIEA
jgi:hypothetical protein